MTPQQAEDLARRQARVRVHNGAIGCEDMVMAEGRVVGYIRTPTILVEKDDGTQSAWGIDLPITELPTTPTYLTGNDDSVDVHCRECYRGGKPLVWYSTFGRPSPYDRDVIVARTIADLARLAVEHDQTHVSTKEPAPATPHGWTETLDDEEM